MKIQIYSSFFDSSSCHAYNADQTYEVDAVTYGRLKDYFDRHGAVVKEDKKDKPVLDEAPIIMPKAKK
jgi:hypothetical protein